MSGISSTLQILNSLGGYSQSRPHKCNNAVYYLTCSENAQNTPTLKKVQRLNYFRLTAATMLLRLYAYGTENAPQQCCIHVEMTMNNHHLCSKNCGGAIVWFQAYSYGFKLLRLTIHFINRENRNTSAITVMLWILKQHEGDDLQAATKSHPTPVSLLARVC